MNLFVSSELTHPGNFREINEDALLSKPEQGLWVVADGMGGYEAGDVASNMVIKALDELPVSEILPEAIEQIEDAIHSVNKRIIQYSGEFLEGRVFGTTVVALLIHNNLGFVLWAGDSRLYRLRNNELKQLTRDHSQLQELIDSGLLTAEEINNYPDQNIITRAVGAETELLLEMCCFEVDVDDKYILCSDGLYNAISEQHIEAILNMGTIKHNSDLLIKKALENGAKDNVTYILIQNNDVITVTNVQYKN